MTTFLIAFFFENKATGTFDISQGFPIQINQSAASGAPISTPGL